jgi:arabinofuranosyltransferase
MNKRTALPFIFLCLYIALLIRSAWISDDAFITLRTVDNFTHGYGLVWNVGERVQTYTHPLWMFLLTGIYLILPNGYLAAMSLSLVISVIVVALFLYLHREDPLLMIAGCGALLLSRSFMDYSTSGLENPLSHLLALLFTVIFLSSSAPVDKPRFFPLALLAGLSTLDRLDTFLIYLPALIYLYISLPKDSTRITALMGGFLPVILWEIFSVVYYGFPFPNTAYAKLNAGIPFYDLMRQGVQYFYNSIVWDPITLFIVVLSFILAVWQRRSREGMLVIGMALYLLYILSIGGDFMSGRFFSTVFLIALVLFLSMIQNMRVPFKPVLMCLILLPGILSPISPLTYFIDPLGGLNGKITDHFFSGISDERRYYYEFNGLLMMDGTFESQHPWAQQGRSYRGVGEATSVELVVGMVGYYAGPKIHIVDMFAIGDPFLARLETHPVGWRSGHFGRPIIAGYLETVQTGENRISDPNLAEYYDKLKIIISGDLFSFERIKTIWKMNTGQYRYLLEGYTD